MNDQTYDVNSRYAWDLGSKLDVYSRSQSEWYIGTITGWYIDQETNKEWFIVRYDGNKTKLIFPSNISEFVYENYFGYC